MAATPTFCTFDRHYVKTVPALLKIVEAVLCMISFICAVIPSRLFTRLGGGWVQFVTIFACIALIVLFFCYLFNILDRCHDKTALVVLIFYAVYDVILLICGIIVAVRASQYRGWLACAVFIFFTLVVFILDTLMQFEGYRKRRETPATSTI